MWRCPKCNTQNDDNKKCQKCGWDDSQNLIKYRTIARINRNDLAQMSDESDKNNRRSEANELKNPKIKKVKTGNSAKKKKGDFSSALKIQAIFAVLFAVFGLRDDIQLLQSIQEKLQKTGSLEGYLVSTRYKCIIELAFFGLLILTIIVCYLGIKKVAYKSMRIIAVVCIIGEMALIVFEEFRPGYTTSVSGIISMLIVCFFLFVSLDSVFDEFRNEKSESDIS